MKGLLLTAGLLLAAIAACSSTSSPSSSGGDAGSATGCPCSVPDGNATVTIACGQIGCAAGGSYLCQRSGQTDYLGPCSPVDDGGLPVVEACAPQCPKGQCNISDQCGGVCGCTGSDMCIAGVCGNGCSLGVGSYCMPGSTTLCCASGNDCAPNDAGVDQCCALTGTGLCTADTDCCDYPAVHCVTVKTDAGAVLSRSCG